MRLNPLCVGGSPLAFKRSAVACVPIGFSESGMALAFPANASAGEQIHDALPRALNDHLRDEPPVAAGGIAFEA
jgi:hypothetical protein